ncbi:MAG: hypothetical protein ACO398_06775, partial [Kiritimatiellia bacterium]
PSFFCGGAGARPLGVVWTLALIVGAPLADARDDEQPVNSRNGGGLIADWGLLSSPSHVLTYPGRA